MGGFIGLCHRRMLISAHGRKSENFNPAAGGKCRLCDERVTFL
jgi:hypothetical protein